MLFRRYAAAPSAFIDAASPFFIADIRHDAFFMPLPLRRHYIIARHYFYAASFAIILMPPLFAFHAADIAFAALLRIRLFFFRYYDITLLRRFAFRYAITLRLRCH